MIKIEILNRGQGTEEMTDWVSDTGIVFRRDWHWYHESSNNCYVYCFDQKFEKFATMFSLKFSA